MSWQAPNLARRPFVNARPLARLAAVLTLAALALSAWNVTSTVRSGSGAAERRGEIDRLSGEAKAARERAATLEADLARWDLAAENRRAEFLNARIVQRTFGWNALLDRLAEAQPRGVRLRTLTPRFAGSEPHSGQEEASVARAVFLSIAAEAEDDEAMLEFVDALFAHRSFAAPNLARESRGRGGDIAFDLSVDYLPEALP